MHIDISKETTNLPTRNFTCHVPVTTNLDHGYNTTMNFSAYCWADWICSVDTLAFPWENNDGRVKTNWYAPNLHIDWELHQASLMSPDFEDETGDYNEVTTQDHTWLFKSRAANMQTQSMVMFPPQICKQDCCLQMFKRWMLWSPNLNDNNFMSLQHDRTADRFFSASLFNEEKPK